MMNILVVDDDKDILRVVQKLLESVGYSAVTCTDAHDALEKLAQESFDLVLSDANMPAVSGFDLVKTIRAHAKWNNTAIALLTGRREKKDVEYGLQCGADDYLVKPIDPELFLSKVESLLNKKNADRPQIVFTESPVHMKADWKVSTEITDLSEQGLTLWSPISAAPNSKFKVTSQLFELIGIEPPTMRALRSIPDANQPHMSFTRVSFVGLTEAELQKIRFWINSNIANYRNKEKAS